MMKITKLDEIIQSVVKDECRLDIPIVAQMDFGHTSPIFSIPYGAKAEIDPVNKTFSILDSAIV